MADAAMPGSDRLALRFDGLYRAHYAEVLAYFARRIPRLDAEDATSDVFAVAWRRSNGLPEGDEAVAWLFGVAHHVLSNYSRSWHRAVRLSHRLAGLAAPVVEPPDVYVMRSAEDRLLLRALNQLSPSDQEVLKLATWERLSHRSIGQVLGLSEQAVGQRISRARKRLAASLNRLESRQSLAVPLLRKKEG